MNDVKETAVTTTPETLSLAEIRAMGLEPVDFLECEELHLDDLTTDRLAPHELASVFSGAALDDLDHRARAIVYGWHDGEALEQDIMAIANALPKLTAALRQRGATCS